MSSISNKQIKQYDREAMRLANFANDNPCNMPAQIKCIEYAMLTYRKYMAEMSKALVEEGEEEEASWENPTYGVNETGVNETSKRSIVLKSHADKMKRVASYLVEPITNKDILLKSDYLFF